MSERVKLVSEFIDRVKSCLKACGFDEPQFVFHGKKIDAAEEKDFKLLEQWLAGFEVYVKNYETQYKLIPEERWEWYRNHGITTLAEHRLLNNAITLVKVQWRTRPVELRRNPNERDRKTKGRSGKSLTKNGKAGKGIAGLKRPAK